MAHPTIVALASAFPPNEYTQTQYLDAFLRNHTLNPADEDFTRRVWAGSKIKTCRSYLQEQDLFRKFTRGEYVRYVKSSLKDLALRSTKQVLANWGGPVDALTHIIFGTMTGSFHAPSMDVEVMLGLGLPLHLHRLNVENMGCLTGFRCLGLAADIARADREHVVLVVVCDIRSALGNQLQPQAEPHAPIDKSNVITSSLFRDSGAAAIVTCNDKFKPSFLSSSLSCEHKSSEVSSSSNESSSPSAASSESSSSTQIPRAIFAASSPADLVDNLSYTCPPLCGYEILAHRSAVLPNSFDLVSYREHDDAVIHLKIEKDLPPTIAEHIKPLVEKLLQPFSITIPECTYAVHTGGPRVLQFVQQGLGIGPEHMQSSYHCMYKYGNLSGSSNLVVLDHIRKVPEEIDRPYIVGISFGPGVGVECVLMKQARETQTETHRGDSAASNE